MISLNFLGRGSAFNLKEGSNSAYFEYEDSLFVIDSGETTLISLDSRVNFEDYKNIYYLITHLHNDHIGSLGSTISYLKLIKKTDVTIVHPCSKIVDLLDLMGINRSFYHFSEETHLQYNDLTIEFVETTHANNMLCYGIYLKANNTNIYYSGDSNDIPIKILDLFNQDKIDILYQDVTIDESHSNSHMYYKLLLSRISKNMLHKIRCMHLENDAQNILEKHNLISVNL